MKKAVIYCRVSTTKQEKDGESLENQEKACRQYCMDKGIQILSCHKEAFTGKRMERPVLTEAILQAEINKVEYFIIFDIDRFSRQGYRNYDTLKETLASKGIILKDSKHVIGESRLVYENDTIDMAQYSWNRDNPTQYAEMILSTTAEIEGKKILQRTISREIQLEQKGYQVRDANFGYINKRINTGSGKATIQEKHPIEGDWIIEMFELRSRRNVSDSDIAFRLNEKGFTTRKGGKCNVKLIQCYIKKTIYAGIVCSKWTGKKPIKAMYKGLVSTELWNKANKGKVRIIELDEKEIIIEYRNKKEQIQINEPIIEKRSRYNPEFQFARVLLCPKCGGTYTPNNSRSGNGTIHPYYQCRGRDGIKHSTYTLKKDEVHKTVFETLSQIQINDNIKKLYREIAQEVFQEKEQLYEKSLKKRNKELKDLEDKEGAIISNLENFSQYPAILEAKNKELIELKEKKAKLQSNTTELQNDIEIEDFLRYSEKVFSHKDFLASQKQKPELINLLFEAFFSGRIEFEKVSYHTTSISKFYSYQSQQKNPSGEEFSRKSVMAAPLGIEHSSQDLESGILTDELWG